MKEFVLRWREVGIVAGVLFAINVAGRFAAKMIKAGNQQTLDDRQALAGFITLGAIALVFLALTLYWGRIRSMWEVGTNLGFAAVIACVLSIFLAPLIVGKSPFEGGAGNFFSQIWWWGGLAIGGVTFGFIILISFTADYKSKQLKSFAERQKAQPKRV